MHDPIDIVALTINQAMHDLVIFNDPRRLGTVEYLADKIAKALHENNYSFDVSRFRYMCLEDN